MANFAEPSYIRDVIANGTIKPRSVVKFVATGTNAGRVVVADGTTDRVAGVSLNNFDVAAGERLEIATGGVAVVAVSGTANTRDIYNGSMLTATTDGTTEAAGNNDRVFGFALSELASGTDGEVEARLTLTHELLA